MNVSDYKYRIELHAHTSPCSGCSSVKAARMPHVQKENGVDAVVITNHLSDGRSEGFASSKEYAEYYLADYREAKKVGDEIGVNVILGSEVYFEGEFDQLVYGISEDDIEKLAEYAKGTYADFYKDFKSDDNVIVQAHPFRPGVKRMPIDLQDGIEVFNLHPGHNSGVGVAAKYAKQNNLPIITCGSDFHDEPHQAMALLRTKTLPKDSFELAKILQSRDYLFEISGNIVVPYCFYEKDEVEAIENKYGYRIEMHAHSSPVSKCAKVSPKELVDLYKTEGYDAVVLTNHFNYTYRLRERYEDDKAAAEYYLSDYRAAKEYGESVGVKVLLGMELGLPYDYLIYGIDESFIDKAVPYVNAEYEQFYGDLKDDKNLMVFAHPYRYKEVYKGEYKLNGDVVDGVEAFNMDPDENSRVGLAARYAKRSNCGIVTCGSDMHVDYCCGMVALRTKTLPEDSFELADILKSRDYVIEIGGNMIFPYGYCCK